MENPIKMDDLGVPLFLETPTWIQFMKVVLFLNPTVVFFLKNPLDFGTPCSEGPPRMGSGETWNPGTKHGGILTSPHLYKLCVWAYVRENPAPKIAGYKVQDMFHF